MKANIALIPLLKKNIRIQKLFLIEERLRLVTSGLKGDKLGIK